MTTTTFQRTALAVKNEIAVLKELGWPFTVQHGTYTTKIVKQTLSNVATTAYVTVQFRQKVFIAARMVKNDVIKSPQAQEIMQNTHWTRNYGNSDTITHLEAPELLNIDIRSAYPNCMLNNGLITEKTANYLRGLDKLRSCRPLDCWLAATLCSITTSGNVIWWTSSRPILRRFFSSLFRKLTG